MSVIEFDTTGQAARINYSVPLPGHHTGRRIMKLDGLGIDINDWSDASKDAGVDVREELGLATTEDGKFTFDTEKAFRWWKRRAAEVGISSDELALVENRRSRLTPYIKEPTYSTPFMPDLGGEGGSTPITRETEEADVGQITIEDIKEMAGAAYKLYKDFIERLYNGILQYPLKTWGGGITSTYVDIREYQAPSPSLYIVEISGISSFMGDYGLGRTVKTFTLLPGESVTISMRTWQATKESIAEGSSIIDSHHEEASEKFGNSVLNETTDKATKSTTESWHAEAEAKASWGWGSAKVSGGGAGEYQTGREEFAKRVNETTKEHAREASAKRELTITSSSERTEEREEETVIERMIKNVNMRRTLNFAFRELNQEYITKIHLKDVRIAFTNGRLNSWREVSLSGLRAFLEELLANHKVDDVAKAILQLVGVVFDHSDNPVQVLEVIEMESNGQNWHITDAALNNDGEYAPPTDFTFYRFKRGPLSQENETNPVAGVAMKEDKIVMRTDSVLVEALLGQADALDNYAMQIQEAVATAKTLENRRQRIALATLREIRDPKERAEAFSAMFNAREETE